MRVVALVSGGKDSCYNMMQCVAAGHSLVALANLQPKHKDELDSYMYQTVGHQGIDLYAEAMGLPLYREVITGEAVNQGRDYKPTDNDEVEDLYRLLSKIKKELSIEAVAVGAILSDYQRIRVENVCRRLGLVSLAYLWRRNQKELLKEMIANSVEAIIIKVAALGLDPRVHLGLSLREIQPHLLMMSEKYGLNVCGEGGEYETFTLDCPLFKYKLVIDEKDMVLHADDPVAPVGYLNLKLHLEPKENHDGTIKLPPTVKGSLDFVSDLNDTVFSDLSDADLSESELESIEKLEKEELKKHSESNPCLSYSGDEAEFGEGDGAGYTYEFRECDTLPVRDHSSIYGNRHGWHFVGGVVGLAYTTTEATHQALNKLINLLATQGMRLQDVCSVNIYMRDMEDYAMLNDVYIKYFNFDNPPTRVCVQCPLPKDVGLILDAVAHKMVPNSQETDNSITKERITMHVQGISHWAPANIGPYSQAVKIGEVIGTSGQIALVPGNMTLCTGGARQQCTLSLRHLTRVLRAVHPRAHIRSVVLSVCYMTGGVCAGVARRQLERRTAGALVQYAAVQALPKHAQLEWHAWAHTDNYSFEYEETGCNVGDYKVAITRRWNYENTVAAFVCYVSTGSSPSSWQLSFPSIEACASHRSVARDMTSQQLQDVLHYALAKILPMLEDNDNRTESHALKVRIFYQVWSGPDVEVILDAVDRVRSELCCGAAVTAVPVLALHNATTFLSISGLRLDESPPSNRQSKDALLPLYKNIC